MKFVEVQIMNLMEDVHISPQSRQCSVVVTKYVLDGKVLSTSIWQILIVTKYNTKHIYEIFAFDNLCFITK